MFRFQIALLSCLALSSCAGETQPLPAAPSLLVALTTDDSELAAQECPDVIGIYGTISDPTEFVALMHACADRAVVIEINSPGGSVFAALEMQKAIERHSYPVVCVVDGLAASA